MEACSLKSLPKKFPSMRESIMMPNSCRHRLNGPCNPCQIIEIPIQTVQAPMTTLIHCWVEAFNCRVAASPTTPPTRIAATLSKVPSPITRQTEPCCPGERNAFALPRG